MNKDEEAEAIEAELKRLRPVDVAIDPRVVFYQAGFSAGKSEQSAPRHFKIAPLIAAGLIAAMVTGPTSYRIGRSSAIKSTAPSNMIVASSPGPGSTPLMLPSQKESDEIASSQVSADDQKNLSHVMDLFAEWIDPLHDRTKTMEIERTRGTTLAVFHSSLLEEEKFASSPSDFPFPIASVADLSSNPFGSRVDTTNPQPLTASDFRELALTPETTR